MAIPNLGTVPVPGQDDDDGKHGGGNPDERDYHDHIGQPRGTDWTRTQGRVDDFFGQLKRGKHGYYPDRAIAAFESAVAAAAGANDTLSGSEITKLRRTFVADHLNHGLTEAQAEGLMSAFTGTNED